MTATTLSPAQTEQKIEAYFAQAPAFAQPICEKIREAIAAADPELKPSWKWNSPVYEKEGPGMVCGLGIFKKHVSLSFFQGALLPEPNGFSALSQDSKGMRSFKFTEAGQLPEAELVSYIRAAANLPKGAVAKTAERDVVVVPDDLKQVLEENGLRETFEKLAYTHRKEYVRWINEAKRPETRTSRLTKTAEKVAAGLSFS